MKHNKYKNVGVIFESLIHYAMYLISEGKTEKATEIMKVVRNNFMKKTIVAEAYNIYSQLLYSEAINYYHASKFYNRLVKEYGKLDEGKLNASLSNIFKQLKENFNIKEIMDTKIPNYKLFSSFRIASNKDSLYLSPKNTMTVETVIIEHLVNNTELKKLKENNIEVVNKSYDEMRTDKMATIIAFKNFEKSYSSELTEEQKECLIKYYSSDDNSFKEWVNKKINSLMDEISDAKLKIENENTIKKLDLIYEKISHINNSENIDSNGFIDLLMSLKLYEYLRYV